MKIKIKNVFDPEKDVEILGLLDDKNVSYQTRPGDPNMTFNCETKEGYPVFLNMSKTACLAIKFSGDDE